MNKLFSILFFLLTCICFSQTKIKGQVVDFDTTIPIAFTKVFYQNQSVETDWEGKFEIAIDDVSKPLVVKHKGYYDKYAYATKKSSFLLIRITTDINASQDELYTSNAVNKIIKKVIDSKHKNNPETRLKSYQFKNYDYLFVTANPDSISSKIDVVFKKNLFGNAKMKLDSSNYKFKKLISKQHLYQTEKINFIQHTNYKTKETVLASRMAGFKEPVLEYLGLKLLSYSVYENPFEILEIQVQNPISNFGRFLYNYNIVDTVSVEGRKTYRIYFQPKKLRANKLRGLLYVDAQSFAIAKAYYRIYGVVNINATYTFKYLPEYMLWFPNQRDIIVSKGTSNENLKILGNTIQFNTSSEEKIGNNTSDQLELYLKSKTFDIEINKPLIIHEPYYEIDIPKESLTPHNNIWNTLKNDTIDKRRIEAYNSIDSLSVAEKIEHRLLLGRKIINGYFPVSMFDVDLRSVVKYNNYEGFRFGLGAITNDKLSENFKIGFYGAYGLKDRQFKFGITPSIKIDNLSETWLSASYTDDLNEIAETSFSTDKKRFKIYDPRPINISTFYNSKSSSLQLESKLIPKTFAVVELEHNQITPLFNYTFVKENISFKQYNLATAKIALQWSPFSSYMKTPKGILEFKKRYPKFSLQFTQSIPDVLESDFSFSKIDFKTYYELGFLSGQKSTILFQGGIILGDAPLTHLYSIAPNNINKDAILKRITFAGKNSFETMYYNEFFSDKFASVHFKHTFNRINLGYKIDPEISVATRMAWGSIQHPENHIGLPFKSLEKGFIESGIEAAKIYKGLGLTAYYRYGPNQLARFDDNISIKISYHIDLGF